MFLERIMRGVESRDMSGATLSEPPDWMWDAFGAAPSYTGKRVSVESSLGLVAVYAAVRILAEAVGVLPLIVYREAQDGSRRRAPQNRWWQILHDSPNPEQPAGEVWEQVTGHMNLWGNAFLYKAKDELGRVVELWPIRPSRVRVGRVNGKRVYEILQATPGVDVDPAGTVVGSEEDILHIRGFGTDGLLGLSPIQLARQALGTQMAAEEYQGRLYANSAQPTGVLQHPGKLSEEAAKRLKANWDSAHKGLANAAKTAVLEEGLEWKPVALSMADQQFIEQQDFGITQIARLFRVPAHMLNASTSKSLTYCLPAGALVETERGPLPIIDVGVGMKVWAQMPEGAVLKPVTWSGCTGHKALLKIGTGNRTLRCTENHPLLVRRRRALGYAKGRTGPLSEWTHEWTPAGELAVGDVIVIQDELPADYGVDHAPTGEALDEDTMWLLGLLLGDGNLHYGPGGKPRALSIARAGNARYIDKLHEVMGRFESAWGRPSTVTVMERFSSVSSTPVAEQLFEWGFAGTARTKTVPGWIFGLNANLRSAFLRGYGDADGSVDKRGMMAFYSVNGTLLSQVRSLCMGLGVPVGNLIEKPNESILPNGRAFHGRIFCFAATNGALNAERIGSHDPQDLERMQAVNRHERLRYYGHSPSPSESRFFPPAGCWWSQVRTIEPEPAVDVYDLTVEDAHNFRADGVVVHNSTTELEGIHFVTYSLMRWTTRIEQALQADPDTATMGAVPEFLLDGLLRADSASRAVFYAAALSPTQGWMSRGEVRDLENLPPEAGDGQEGDPTVIVAGAPPSIPAAPNLNGNAISNGNGGLPPTTVPTNGGT